MYQAMFREKVTHLMAGCLAIAPSDYVRRHDNVAKIIHQELCKKYKALAEPTPYFKYSPPVLVENKEVKIYWNQPVTTARTIACNKPDIILVDKQNKTTYLIEVSVPNSSNLEKKKNEKITKYLELCEEIREMWNQTRVQVVPVIISTTGVIPKNLKQSLELLEIPWYKHALIQKSVLLDTCHSLRKVLNIAT